MKKILITGANSYIGTSFEQYLQQWPQNYSIDTVDVIGESWKEKSFADYDAVFHVAGIAHVSTDPKLKDLYYKVNRDLAIETALKAKQDGVKQFLFMSSIIVYGDSSGLNRTKVITKDTVPAPTNFYGKSKLEAEEGIRRLSDNAFMVAVLRSPMIYGKGCKGNYQKLAAYAKKLPIFLDINNQRSMLYIDNLCEFVRLLIDNCEEGLYFPQNEEYVSTSEMVRLIANAHGKKIRLISFLNPLIFLLGHAFGIVNKVFGNLIYDCDMSKYKAAYCIKRFDESVRNTEAT